MADNPLAGISIPSLNDIAEEVVGRMGTSMIDLANLMQRKRLKDYIEQALGMVINFELERALQAASNKAITHVFRVMRDADYQEKKKQRRGARAKVRLATQLKQKEIDRQARMERSRGQLKTVVPKKDLVQ